MTIQRFLSWLYAMGPDLVYFAIWPILLILEGVLVRSFVNYHWEQHLEMHFDHETRKALQKLRTRLQWCQRDNARLRRRVNKQVANRRAVELAMGNVRETFERGNVDQEDKEAKEDS